MYDSPILPNKNKSINCSSSSSSRSGTISGRSLFCTITIICSSINVSGG